MFTGSWQMRTLLFILIQCSSFCIQARINNGELSSFKVLLILRPSLSGLLCNFSLWNSWQTLMDSFIHPSTQQTFIESLSSATHLRLERKNYSVARFCVKTLSIYILSSPNFYPLISLGGYWLTSNITWTLWSSFTFYYYSKYMVIYLSVCLPKKWQLASLHGHFEKYKITMK